MYDNVSCSHGLLLIWFSDLRIPHDSTSTKGYIIFANVAWLSLSLVLASLLLSVKKTLLVSVFQLVVLLLLSALIPEMDLKSIGLSVGFLSVFSGLLIITMWQRNLLEAASQDEIRRQATHDQLTGLPNRNLFQDRLNQALARIIRKSTLGSILYLDLDYFKNVNDEYGHDVGDLVLRMVAERLQTSIRSTDTAARISGDEFIVLLENIKDSENAAKIAKKILDSILLPIKSNNSEIMISASIGIAMIPEDGESNSELIQNADIAMYRAKSEGKNSYSFFISEMKAEVLNSITLSKNLHHALEQREFNLKFQPQYDTRTGKVFGAEALLRWQHPQQGKIGPREFIPEAEKNGLIVPIGEWVIENVVAFQNDFNNSSHRKIRVAVNISERQLRDSQLVHCLGKFISRARIDPALLELEITENSIFNDFNYSVSILKGIKTLGVRLAIDDFGTGYSSLSYLERFPVDTIKIDISFVHRISDMNVKLPILTGIVSIASEMGLDVIAEGVETETQLKYLNSIGCYMIQGHYFNAALEKSRLLSLLAKQ